MKKALMFAVAIFITLGVIGMLIVGYNMAAKSANNLLNKAGVTTKNLENADMNTLIASTQLGTTVVNSIHQYADSGVYPVKVITLAGGSATYNKSPLVEYTITDPTDSTYINPVGDFKCTLTKANEIVTLITFTQQ